MTKSAIIVARMDPQSLAPFPVHEHRSIMEQNIAAYKAMHVDLVERYLGQYVAISSGHLVDRDPDPLLLLERIRQNYPDQVVLRRKVERTHERELHIRHPRVERAGHRNHAPI